MTEIKVGVRVEDRSGVLGGGTVLVYEFDCWHRDWFVTVDWDDSGELRVPRLRVTVAPLGG